MGNRQVHILKFNFLEIPTFELEGYLLDFPIYSIG